MHLDPYFQEISLVFLFLFAMGLLSKLAKFPNAIGFLISGVVLGPNVLNIISKDSSVNHIGSIGVVLLLFFVGIELSPRDLIRDWKINFVGTIFQIALSVGCIFVVGWYLDWPLARIILLGFVISLSSTAMVIQLLSDHNQTSTRLGKDSLGILVTQDILIVPMMIILGLVGNKQVDVMQFFKQAIGGTILIAFFILSPKLIKYQVAFVARLKNDSELLLLFCLSFAFGMALISGLFELSTALGAFIAGSIVGQLKMNHLFHEALNSFKVIFMAVFFASIGLLLDLKFFLLNFSTILTLSLLALITNTFLNAFILKSLGRTWKMSFLTASYLAQIGEFSFLLAAIGLQEKIVNEYVYQTTMYIIFISIILTPFWVKMVSKLTKLDIKTIEERATS